MVTIVRYTNPPEPGSVSVAHTFCRGLPGNNNRSVALTYCVITMLAVWKLEADDYGEDQEMIDEDDLLTAVLPSLPDFQLPLWRPS